ncbi:MAG: O-antigen ligase family protein [Fuerstiella sp.]|nr:O-antigen ligase family protein [Fuerstiella sp.]
MIRTKLKLKKTGQSVKDSFSSEPVGQFAILASLLACEFYWPSLAAVEGDGLHLSFLWLAAIAGILQWKHWQKTDSSLDSGIRLGKQPWRFWFTPGGLVTAGLVILPIGIWLSTWNVFRVSGDRRAAINLAMAWTAIAACGCLCRLLASHPGCRRTLVNLIAGLATGLAVYGIWQSHVFYAREAESYLEKRRIIDSGTNPLETARIQREFSSTGILDGPGRDLFEERLLNSTEPFGPFALANTLAGVLAVGLVLLSGGLISEWRAPNHDWRKLVIPLAALIVVSWCLILTKSRTAWVGTSVGMILLLIRRDSQSETSRSILWSMFRIVLTIAIPATLLFFIGVLSGVIDRQVLLESPRSLQFRFLYWIGAAGVICAEPLFGSGPGNFRQLYLSHKPVQSSESIMDPHNFLLDVWCFAGVVGFVGMLLIVAGVARSIWSVTPARKNTAKPNSVPVAPGIIGCLFLHFGWHWITGGAFGYLAAMSATAMLLTVFVTAAISRLPWNPLAPAAGCITLLVHLLGAGGLQVTTLWFLFVALASIATPVSQINYGSSPVRPTRLRPFLDAIIWSAAAAATLIWGLIPVQAARVQFSIGQQRFWSGDSSGAQHAFELAAAADPLSPIIRQHIVRTAAYSLMQRDPQQESGTPGKIRDSELNTIKLACDSYVACDKRRIDGRLTRALVYHQVYQITGQHEYIEYSLDDLRQVIEWHPTNAAFRVQLALLEETAGQISAACATAKKAKDIEAVNQEWGHSDQYLSADDIRNMDRIISGGTQ